jgi:hypothetical protein
MIALTAFKDQYKETENILKEIRRFYYLYWMAGKTLTAIKQTSFNVVKWIKDKKDFSFIKIELEKLGYEFISNSDTEVILYSYKEWGIKCIDKFIGMFAFAILDKVEDKLVLVRDRAGVKPLYYYADEKEFMFSSEIKSFHKHPKFKKEQNLEVLPYFFQFGYIPAPYTIFQNCFKLEAGHYLELKIDNLEFKIIKYWDVTDFYLQEKFTKNEDEIIEDIEKIFNADTHTFKELHNIEWFNWHLDYNFSDNSRNHQDLYLVSKNNENIGFFMTKVRFKEKAGQGKLKNLLIGSIIEWGSINPQILTDKELCIMAINKLYKKDKVDIIDIMTDDADTISFLRKSGLKKNGTGNFAIYTGEDSPLNKFPEYKVQTNWRIRPATSDNGLS